MKMVKRDKDYPNYNTRNTSVANAENKDRTSNTHLVVESPVLVLPKERLSDCRESINFQQPQTLLESVVDLNLALSTDNKHTTSTAT
jgi:hypothetical protein